MGRGVLTTDDRDHFLALVEVIEKAIQVLGPLRLVEHRRFPNHVHV
jgi:hypothetical protein